MSQQAIAYLQIELQKLSRRVRDLEAANEALKARVDVLEKTPMSLAATQIFEEVKKLDPSVAEEMVKKTAPVKVKKKPKKDA